MSLKIDVFHRWLPFVARGCSARKSLSHFNVQFVAPEARAFAMPNRRPTTLLSSTAPQTFVVASRLFSVFRRNGVTVEWQESVFRCAAEKLFGDAVAQLIQGS